MSSSELIQATDSQTCCTSEWESAYLRFETPEEEISKFIKRLQFLGADRWAKELRIVEMFCGRGNALVAWERLGFQNLTGVDLSATLLDKYLGPAKRMVADCRQMPFESDSQDVMCVHGGLHHLPLLPDDLQQTLSEVRRILAPQGRLVVVEPWRTPFLTFVHALSRIRPLRRVWSRIDAFATMYEHEHETYDNWLSRPQEILKLFQSHFSQSFLAIRRGKIYFVGQK